VKRLRIPTTVVDAPTATSRDGTVYYLLTSDQVPGIDGRVVSSGYVHVGCPLHGSDHQPSLHIQVMDADGRGFGRCFSCTKQVLVTDLNAEAAAHLTGKAGGSWQPRRVTAEALLRPPRRQVASEPTPELWQRAELGKLSQLAERMRARLADDRPRAYLEGRGIPYDIALDAGVGYVPGDARLSGNMRKWRDRLVFPLSSPVGAGFAGRSLWGWVPGMDEDAHKQLLEATPNAPLRWLKTYPAGWLNFGELATAETAVLVEGPVDLVALLAAGMEGMPGTPVVALVGTAGRAEWIPANVRSVVLALDGDQSGGDAAKSLARDLTTAGVAVRLCVPTSGDGRGKDWAERWRVAQWEGVYSVFDALDELSSATSS
jgi:DNA primase